MTMFCARCGSRREDGASFCPSCGTPFGSRSSGRRRGGHAATGLLLVLLGGAWLFVPLWPASGGISIWQSHDLCSSVLGALAASDCSTVSLLWAIGLGLVGLGAITLLAAALRPEPTRPEPPPRPRLAPSPATAYPTPVAPPVLPPVPVPVPAPQRDAPVASASEDAHTPRSERWARAARGPRGSAAILGLGVILVVAGVLLAASLAATPARQASSASVSVPVIACATTYGTGDVQAPQAASATVALPPSLAVRVALFATNYQRVLAPREFRCTAEVGADGASLLTVASYDDSAAVVAQTAGQAHGDVLSIACPLFPEAAALLRQDYGADCPAPPAAELVTRDGTTARFEDPAGVAGTGDQSGGALRAVGAIVFAGGDASSATRITCVLPDSDRAVCDAAVSDWVASFRPLQ